jgi:diguanylate cyclase (GGDEF)-like protein/PAS domain S-box-containing protein
MTNWTENLSDVSTSTLVVREAGAQADRLGVALDESATMALHIEHSGTKTSRLILVEDSPQDAALYSAMLRSTALNELFDVVVVGRLSECVTALAGEAPACVVLDLGLPDAEGVEGIARIRIVAPDVPVVVLTGTDDESMGLQALECGAQDYLVKGRVDSQVLARAIRYAIERMRAEQRIHFLAFHDPLTELANRALFGDRLEVALTHSRRRTPPASGHRGGVVTLEEHTTPAVLVIDLDYFKLVNDSLGHATGDELLKTVARRLESVVRPSDTVARLGGDEFAILCEGATVQEAAGVARRVIAALSAPVLLDGSESFVGASVGVATAPMDSTDGDGLLRNADIAMYRAKAGGRGRFVVFADEMRTVVRTVEPLVTLPHLESASVLALHMAEPAADEDHGLAIVPPVVVVPEAPSESDVAAADAAARPATVQRELDAGDEMSRFAKVVSHDFSGPLRTIRGFASLLRDNLRDRINDDERSHLGEIIRASVRMQTLNDGLVACIRARSVTLEVTDVGLSTVVERCLEKFGQRIVAQGVRVTVARGLPVVRADPAMLQVVLHHLLDNALRYTDTVLAPTIEIAATLGAAEWTIVVRDNGPGIPEISRERVFALFKRLEPASELDCPGIGLTLSRTIIERHGGRLWIDAAPGGGTEATFTLPIDVTSDLLSGSAARGALPGLTYSAAPSHHIQSRAALAAIVESSDDAIFSKDLDGIIITWNRAAEMLYGYSVDEAIGRHTSMLTPPDRPDELLEMMDTLQTETRVQVETVRLRKDGKLIDVSLSLSPVRDDRGVLVAASVIARDITVRHRADEQMRGFLEVAPDAIVVVTDAGVMSAVNSQAEAAFGYSREELVGQPLEMLLPERFRDGHVAHRLAFTAKPVKRLMGAGLTLFGLRKDGTEFPVSIQLSSIPTWDGIRSVAAIRDITEQRRLERIREDFIANAAHELRTPLTTLAGLGETLSRSFDVMARNDIDDAFGAMARQGNRARVLITNLLDLSKIEGGRAEFTIVDVELRPLIRRVLEVAHPPDDNTVVVRVPDNLILLADASRLEQVVSNLLVNAYRYGGPTIQIGAGTRGSNTVFWVEDDGKGVELDLVSELFEPFTRGREAVAVRGSGIGLALCRRIVQGMDGRIDYEPVAPHGSRFSVTLRSKP